MFDQNDDRVLVVVGGYALEPSVFGYGANAHLAGVHEVARAFDVDGATGRIVGVRRGLGSGVFFGKAGVQFAIIANHMAKQPVGRSFQDRF